MIRVLRIPFSTNVERVALAAGHKGIAVEWVDIDPADRSPVRELSGQDLVPVLEADGEVVFDSTEIMRWLEARRPEPPLFTSAEVELFVDWFNRVWKVPPNAIADGHGTEAHAAEMRASLDLFEHLLDGRDHLFGDFSAADCAAFPFLKYAAFGLPEGDDEIFHRVLVENLPLAHPRVEAWIRRVDEHPRA